MGHAERYDEPGSWHHVMNRGIAKRTMFETESDIRRFLSRVARTVRGGSLEVHAYSVLTTHFHLLVRSPRGELSDALQEIQGLYVRHFNISRKRDGSLVRGRFKSIRVHSRRYRSLLVRYIDDNAVRAGITPSPFLYPHGSARHHIAPRAPLWICRDWIHERMADSKEDATDPVSRYVATFPPKPGEGLCDLVRRRVRLAGRAVDDSLDQLFLAATPAVKDWMVRKAKLADGTKPGLPVADAASAEQVVRDAFERTGPWRTARSRKSVDAWALCRVAILREYCGLTLREVALRLDRSIARVSADAKLHRDCLLADDAYATRFAELTQRAVQRCS